MGSDAPGSAVLNDDALTKSDTSDAILIGSRSLNSSSVADAAVSPWTKSTSRCPDSGDRLATAIDDTPA